MKQVFPPFGTLIEVKKNKGAFNYYISRFCSIWAPHLHQQNQHRVRPPLPLNADVILEPKTVSLPSIWVQKNTMLASEVRPPPCPPPLSC